ncbi:MAG TPA: helix-turn-helix transcriptional regulator [Dongiaceae bacterium]|nr:helix-turn-helix transcriptional regulator [Dongiaceae bacterium]
MARTEGCREWTHGHAKELAGLRAGLGAAVRGRRLKLRMSQMQLAGRCGVSNKTINMVEYAHNFPSLALYIALCRALKAGKIPLVS